MAKNVVDRYTPEGKRFMKALRELTQYEVKIGFQRGRTTHPPARKADGTRAKGAPVDIVDIAAFNELGTDRSPSRPFMRRSVDDNIPLLQKLADAQKRKLLKGVPAKIILNQIGLYGKKLVQKKIAEGPFQQNAPSTIKAKERKAQWNKKGVGGVKPLIDEGTMRKAVIYIVKRK